MKKLSLALAAASALSLGLASTAQAGEGGIAAGAAATFDGGDLTSLSVAAAVGKESAAVAVRANVGATILQEVATDGMGNPIEEGQTPDVTTGAGIPGTGTIVLVDVEGPATATTEAYALGGSGDITVNSIASSEALNANNVAPNPVLEGGDDTNPGVAQANNLGNGPASFVVFDPSNGGFVTLVEGDAPM
ncbi:hypothetical protein AWQ21_11030 [Picosynechococcus sp. PCC 7003]|uniref:hypothetical protein n=1 Tax=Picosynechococcus sp. PCC 7003 TaxID=374981 RepID=UPI000810A495|nr:hypothetical protein [Picosynechococcus sp. PCC 7003]ANV84865.1 hypothetical protein AWQ21_11030 [Picosynechococcus sp. PCC 7003]